MKRLQLILTVRTEHISGFHNGIADSLSHLQFARFQELAPEAEQNPAGMPDYLWKILESEQGSH